MTIIDTPEGIAWFQFLRVLTALRIEVRSGLKVGRGSLIGYCKQVYGTTAGTKKGTYEQMCAIYEAATGEPYRG